MYQFKYTVTLYRWDCLPLAVQGFDDYAAARNWGIKELSTYEQLHGFVVFDKDKNVIYFQSR